MITELGHFALILALGVAIVQMVVPLIGAWKGWAGWMALAVPAAGLQFAFIAASFVTFSPVAVLTFMVVGPLVDLRLLLMYRATFGTRAAFAIGGLALAGALAAAVSIGSVLL